MTTRKIVLVGVALALLGILADLVANAASSDDRWPWILDIFRKNPWWSLLALGSIVLVCTAVTTRAAKRDGSIAEEGDDGVAARLANDTRTQWQKETNHRRVNDPYPLPVSWRSADQSLTTDWESIVKLASNGNGWTRHPSDNWADGPDGLSGANNEIIDIFDRIPTGRLVVLGEAGSGKTMLLTRLVLGLLNRRQPGDQVPVLLSVASWNPEEEGFTEWITNRLVTEHEGLAGSHLGGHAVTRARALIDSGKVIPVLDGLDEIPGSVLAVAISKINDAMRPGMKLVIASRLEAFRDAVRPAVGPEIEVAGAAAIEICTLDIEDVFRYLKDSAGGMRAANRWNEVWDTVAVDMDHPLRRALKTPLMASLARSIYNPRPGERISENEASPIELLNTSTFPSASSIEEYLYEQFISAVYRARIGEDHKQRWSAAEAERWLRFLASDLEFRQNGTTDLAWWELSGMTPRWFNFVTTGVIAGSVGLVGLIAPLGLGVGVTIAALTSAVVGKCKPPRKKVLPHGLAGGMIGGLTGALLSLAILGGDRVGAYLVGGLTFGVLGAPLGGFLGAFAGAAAAALGSRATEVIVGGEIVSPTAHIANGLGLGIAVGLICALAAAQTPARRLRRSIFGMFCGAAAGAVVGATTWTTSGMTIGLVIGLVSMLVGGYAGSVFFESAAVDTTRAASPLTVLARDRATFRSSFLGLGLTMGLGTGLATGFGPSPVDGLPNGAIVGIGVGIANLVAAGISFAFIQTAWGSFTLSRVLLALRGQLPWRLMTFLADAHTNHGVLRQVGAVYQFRHAEIQRRLARGPQRKCTSLEGTDSDPRQQSSTPVANARSKRMAITIITRTAVFGIAIAVLIAVLRAFGS